MKIVDTFIFYNELDMLEFRLKELNDVVDHFVLVEADKTFAGNPKPLIFAQNTDRFADYIHKIVYIAVTDMPTTGNAWGREYHQRNAITRGVNSLGLSPFDLVLISDVDEIPDTNLLQRQRTNPVKRGHVLAQDMFYYNIECKAQTQWFWAKIMPYSFFRLSSPQKHRVGRYPRLTRGGWHFSYFGDAKFIINKIRQFSHQEFNKAEYTNPEKIAQRIKNCTDLFNRDGGQNFKGPHGFHHCPVAKNNYLPKNYKMLLGLRGL